MRQNSQMLLLDAASRFASVSTQPLSADDGDYLKEGVQGHARDALVSCNPSSVCVSGSSKE